MRGAALFSLVSLSPTAINNRISEFPLALRNELNKLANRVLKTAPSDGYGKAIRYQMAAFLCVSDPNNEGGGEVVDYFIHNPYLVDIELLNFIGEERAKEVLLGLSPKK